MQYFWFSRIGSNPEVRQDTPTLRATAQNKLPQSHRLGTERPGALDRRKPARRLDRDDAHHRWQWRRRTTQVLTRAAQFFQQAIELDSGNADAKQNLELVLRIQRPGKGRFGHDARSGYGFGRGRGVTSPGGGY